MLFQERTDMPSTVPIQTTENFLANGIGPTTPLASDLCPICCCSYTSPIKIHQCSHTFDLECLKSWLTSSSLPTTCPTCRATLFERESLETTVFRVLTSPDFRRETFDIPDYGESLPEGISPVMSDLVSTILTAPQTEFARFDVTVAAACLRMAGDLLIALRRAEGFALSEQELGEYRVAVKAMYDYLATQDGQLMPVASMPIEILVGTITRPKSLDGISLDVETLLPDDLEDLSEEPARRVAMLAFFVTWVSLDRSKEDGFWSRASRPQSNVGG